MSTYTKTKIWFYLISSFIIIAVVLGSGYMAYRLGYSQGAINEQTREVEDGTYPAPDYEFKYHFPYFGFWPPFFGFLFFLMVFALIRRLFFFSNWRRHAGPYWHRMWKYHPKDFWFMDDDERNMKDDAGSSE